VDTCQGDIQVPVPFPTPILRFIHVDNLHLCLRRRGIWAPNHEPKDGLVYRTIHNVEVQTKRHEKRIWRGPGGVLHDYVAFYFGQLSPMMLNLKTGRVQGYNEGQEPLIYLVSTCQAVADSGAKFVFTDGHGVATFTQWYDDLADLGRIDWDIVNERYWRDTVQDMDRQRRKQAEFLVHRFCDWSLIHEIAVINQNMKDRVENILSEFTRNLRREVVARRDWYYR